MKFAFQPAKVHIFIKKAQFYLFFLKNAAILNNYLVLQPKKHALR